MTKSAILDKIEANLAGPPKNEADVVYLLVEIRKYLDHIDPEHNKGYEVLRTYCHWSVHVLLDQGGAKTLLRSLDDAFTTKRTEAEREEAIKAVFERFSLVHFRQELRKFLESEDLSLVLVDDPARWGQFLKHYVAVVSDCPLFSEKQTQRPAIKKESTPQLSIKKATLQINEATRSLENAVAGSLNVVWNWDLEFVDGASRKFSNTYGYQLDAAGA